MKSVVSDEEGFTIVNRETVVLFMDSKLESITSMHLMMLCIEVVGGRFTTTYECVTSDVYI